MSELEKRTLNKIAVHCRAVAVQFGPLLCADDVSIGGLAAASVNAELKTSQFCECREPGEQVYFRNLVTGSHGFMCSNCRGLTQVG